MCALFSVEAEFEYRLWQDGDGVDEAEGAMLCYAVDDVGLC